MQQKTKTNDEQERNCALLLHQTVATKTRFIREVYNENKLISCFKLRMFETVAAPLHSHYSGRRHSCNSRETCRKHHIQKYTKVLVTMTYEVLRPEQQLVRQDCFSVCVDSQLRLHRCLPLSLYRMASGGTSEKSNPYVNDHCWN